MNAIEIEGLFKSYTTTPVLRSVDLTVAYGSITAVLGASGSGKTTLLRVIAGFEDADTGRVSIAGHLVDDGRRTVRPQHRGIGYVPQDAALFPHLTVEANIGFGVSRRHRAELRELTDLVGLTGYEKRYPHQLSGGQQQRVALARALAIQPGVVLLDEPFGSLDAGLRDTVRSEVATILAHTGTTTVLVTHDQDEALSMADHIALLDHGVLTAYDTPRDLYDHPATPDIATAIGIANLLDGHVVDGRVRHPLGEACGDGTQLIDGARCTVLVRPEQIRISTDPQAGPTAARITGIRFHGHDTLIDLAATGSEPLTLTARVAGATMLTTNQHVWLSTEDALHVWGRAESNEPVDDSGSA